jgi:adenosylcobalamin-dependent ribonucleoside-triphosphate reductase
MSLSNTASSPSIRALITRRRTYNRPLNEEGTVFETWEQTCDRVVDHQKWLWERAKGGPLTQENRDELEELRGLMYATKALPSGRTLWLGGTDIAKRREASQFNCSFERVQTVHDVVDASWLLLQGCGVGAHATVGTLNGFSQPVEIEIIRSTRTGKGRDTNKLTFEDNGDTARLEIGDSAEAWAKSIGKMLALKARFKKLILDFSQIRPAGQRLKGYGWISSGDEQISKAFPAVAAILSVRAGELLTSEDINDIINHLGAILSSRRAAEILLHVWGAPGWREFATRKKDHWSNGNLQRAQSNNSLLFYQRPTKADLKEIFDLIKEGGGSEPGFVNAIEAMRRAPWFKGCNPCAEILLGDKSFCNLVEVDLGKFNGDFNNLLRAYHLVARANYRQTCVNLDDGILQRSWHELNEFLRLCGVGPTGIVRWEHQKNADMWGLLKETARGGAFSMADELGMPRPKAVTTVKPSGTLSKVMGTMSAETPEGIHAPLGMYIFNNMNFSRHDPIVGKLKAANYRVFDNPYDTTSVLVTLPVSFPDVDMFTEVEIKTKGKRARIETRKVHVNLESAVDQLDRYRMLMKNYVDHNCSITVSYDESEVPAIIDWLTENWDDYVGVSFIYRNDPTKTAEDLGYPYLPQEVKTREEFDAYVSGLLPVDLDGTDSFDELSQDDCASGACPVR